MEYEVVECLEDVVEILDKACIKNDRYSRQQFEKYIGSNNAGLKWLVSFSDSLPKAMLAFLTLPVHDVLGTYVCMVLAFESGHGYGKDLLLEMARRFPDVWLFANYDGGEELLAFYRQLGWHETLRDFDGQMWHAFSKSSVLSSACE